jgi:SAM-dependent methyltransferase
MQKAKLKELFKSKSGIMLDIGGGGNPQKGYVNMDMRKLPTVDIVHDIEDSRGFPLPDNCVTRVLCSHILEHICPKKLMFVMSEIHRVCRPDAQVMISVPYGGSIGSIQDPTHCAFFNEYTFDYFDDKKDLWYIYRPPAMRTQMRTFDLSGNVEVVLQVIKDKKNEKKK